MGGSRPSPPPPPSIVYAPAPPPPTVTQTPTQSVATQTALNEVSGKQTRLNMELGAKLDRTNAEFFAGQDIRRTQATGAEQRLTQKQAGEIETGLTRVRGRKSEQASSRPALSIAVALRLLVRKPGRRLALKAKKPEPLTCKGRCSVAIKRIGITSRLSASIEHD